MDTEPSSLAWAITWAILFIDLLIRIGLIMYIPKNRKPSAALAWLLAIFAAPLLGTLLFLILGSTRLSRTRRERQVTIETALRKLSKSFRSSGHATAIKGTFAQSALLGEALGGLAPLKGNAVDILNGYDELIASITKSVETAQHYIYIEFFIIAQDAETERFMRALEEAAARGVHVYVLYDAFGSKKFAHYHAMKRRFKKAGIHHRPMLPIRLRPGSYSRPDLRNHRKIVAIDNHTAFVGSLNMIEATYARRDAIHYTELVAKMTGPVASEAAAIVASDWYLETADSLTHHLKLPTAKKAGAVTTQMIPSGPGYAYQNNLKLFVSLMYRATTSIHITNPYFVPDETLIAAITAASKRGVKVSILNSQAMDQWMVGHAQRSYYQELLEAGIDIRLYPAPELIHSKYMVIDNEIAVVGSSNLDIRSFELNLENTTVFYNASVAGTLSRLHRRDLKKSIPLELETWKKRPLHKTFLDSLARLTSDLQ